MGGKITLAIRRRFGYNSKVSSAGVMELVDVVDSKSTAGDSVPVRVRSPAPTAPADPLGLRVLFFFCGSGSCIPGRICLLLLHFFSAEVVDLDLEELGGSAILPDLLVCQLLLRVILHGEALQQRHGLRALLQQATPAEHHDAPEVRRPRLLPDRLAAVDGEAHLVAGPDGFRLVTGTGAVEVNFLRLPVVIVVDGDGVGVALPAVYGQNAPAGLP